MKKKNYFVVTKKTLFEYVENKDDSCDGCDLKGSEVCNSGCVDCIDEDGTFYILKKLKEEK